MNLNQISAKASSTGTPTVVITDTNISGSQDPFMLPVINFFVVPPINPTGRIFTTGMGLSEFIILFVNENTGR